MEQPDTRLPDHEHREAEGERGQEFAKAAGGVMR